MIPFEDHATEWHAKEQVPTPGMPYSHSVTFWCDTCAATVWRPIRGEHELVQAIIEITLCHLQESYRRDQIYIKKDLVSALSRLSV